MPPHKFHSSMKLINSERLSITDELGEYCQILQLPPIPNRGVVTIQCHSLSARYQCLIVMFASVKRIL